MVIILGIGTSYLGSELDTGHDMGWSSSNYSIQTGSHIVRCPRYCGLNTCSKIVNCYGTIADNLPEKLTFVSLVQENREKN